MAHFRAAATGSSCRSAWTTIPPPLTDGRDVRTNAVSDPRTGRLHRFVRQVRIASGGLNLRVIEEFADHGEALAQGQRPRSIPVSYVLSMSHDLDPRPSTARACHATSATARPLRGHVETGGVAAGVGGLDQVAIIRVPG